MKHPSYDPTDYANEPGSGPLRIGGMEQAGQPVHDKSNLPSTLSPTAERQQPALTLVRDVAAGPERMRDKGVEYLPKAPGEMPLDYSNRLKRSVFFNAFGHTVEGLTGFVFRKNPVLGEDVPKEIKGDEEGLGGHWENIDNAGTHGDVFARDLFVDAMESGHCAILVEYPNTGGVRLSLADEKPLRPYWVPIKKDNIMSWRTTVENGKTLLTQLVLRECQMVPDGLFGEKEQTQYRVLYRENKVVGFRLLEVTKDKRVIEVDAGLYANQDEIPVAEIATSGRRGMFESSPPLLDLAYLNIAHYQQASDYFWSIHMTNVPILFGSGFGQEYDENGVKKPALVIGANNAVMQSNPEAKLAYVSHAGESLASSKASLDDLKGEMAVLGIAMLAQEKRVQETATAKRIDKSSDDSKLSVTARRLQDGLEKALSFHAKYMKIDDGGSITVNKDFENLTLSAQDISALSALVKEGQLSLPTLWKRLEEGNVLPDGFNPDDEEAAIAAEQAVREAQNEANGLNPDGSPKEEKKEPPKDSSDVDVLNADGSLRFKMKKSAA